MSPIVPCSLKLLFILLAVCVVLLSKSRTAVICLLVLASVFCIYRIRMRQILKVLFPLVIIMASCGLCSFWKADSTDGRKFILATTWNLIKEKPLAGHGYGGFHREYMDLQGHFFSLHPDSKYAILADDVRHPLNEFLFAWCEYGIGGLILLCTLFASPMMAYLKLKDEMLEVWLCALIPIFIFSLFSYPFHYPLSWMVVIGCICRTIKVIGIRKKVCKEQYRTHAFVCIVMASICLLSFISYEAKYEREWGRIAKIAAEKHPRKVLHRYKTLYRHYSRNPYFLYNYAFVLYSASSFDEAALIAEECGRLWSGYNLELLTGDIYRKKRAYKEAAEHYNMAYNMCPSRFAPLAGLMYTYAECNKKERVIQIAKTIKNKNIKVDSKTVQGIKEEAEMFLRELK
ncbi:MAG: O-antigen ligase family protein [Bacteroides sp.]|nr:O-antigen ligase family protein [Roseburia sp.]MCM1346903.1 O-antigen ligase family protein [Bacteroides sp.]MCM1421435.1 O-antigen ligase family protein [Bacteroides sp.]